MLLLSSCAVQKEYFGTYDKTESNTTIYKKEKDFYLFWDRIQVREALKTLELENYEKITKRSFLDGVIFYGTAGIFSFYTVKVKVNSKTPTE